MASKTQSLSSAHQSLLVYLQANQNSSALKMVVQEAIKQAEDIIYSEATSESVQFLNVQWESQTKDDPLMKKKLQELIQGKIFDLQGQIEKGNIKVGQKSSKFNEKQHANNIQKIRSTLYDKNKSMTLELQSLNEYDIYNPSYYALNSSRTKQVQRQLFNMHNRYRGLEQQIRSRKQIIQKKKQKQAQKASQQQKISQDLKKKQNQQEYIKKLEFFKERAKQRDEWKLRHLSFVRKLKQEKPLYVQMEQNFKQNIQMPLLEEKKKTLQQKRHILKPSLSDIQQHEQKYLSMKLTRPEKQVQLKLIGQQPYKSQMYRKVSLDYRRSLQMGDSQQIFENTQKVRRYAQYVNQNHKPHIDLTKRKELQQLREKQQSSRSQYNKFPDRKQTYELGKLYLQHMRRLVKKNRDLEKQIQQEQQNKKSKNTTRINYLQQLKKLHRENKKNIDNWEQDLGNQSLTDYDKREKILLKSKLLEDLAFRNQLLLKNSKFQNQNQVINQKEKVDTALLGAIKAKIAVLNI